MIDSQRFEEELWLAGQRALSTGHLKTRRRRSPRSLLAIGLLALFSLTSVDGPVQAQAISDASAEIFEFDGLTASVEELYQKKLGGSWCTLRVTVKNTGTERVEPTIEVLTKIDGRFQRSVFWSTVVSPPSEEGGVSERSQLIPCWAWQENAGLLIEFTLRILVDGRALLVEEDPRLTRTRFLNSQGRQVSGGPVPWRIPKSFGVLVVRTTESEEPTGWRTALREELRQSVNMPRIEMNFREASIDQLPTRVEAYESIDRVFLIGVEPQQLVNAQRMALIAAVKLGLRVWVIPGFAGEGNSWIAGDSEPRFRAQTVSDSSGGRQTFFLANPLESDPGEPGDLIVDHGDQQIPGSYCYRDGVGAWLRATSSVGPWSFSESLREIWPQKINEHFDSVVRGGDNNGFLSAIDDRYRRNVGGWTILILIFLYIVVAGPGLFLFLKRKGKLPSMLWLQPLVVVLFVLVTGAIGMVEFGVTVRQHQTYFFFQEEGEDGAVVVDLKSFYSPTSVNRDVEVDSGFTLPIPRPSAVRQKPLRWSIDPVSPELIGFRTQTWSLNHFSSRRGVNLGKVEIHEDQNETPIVVNGLPCSLEFATQIRKSSWSPSSRVARQVAPGAHATLSLNRMLEDRWEMDLYRRVRGSLEHQWERSDFYPIAFAELRVSELPTEFLERSSDDCRAFLVVLRRKTSP